MHAAATTRPSHAGKSSPATESIKASLPRAWRRIAESIVREALTARTACISCQVVQEYLDVALRKVRVGLSPEAVCGCLDAVLLPPLQTPASAALYHRAVDIQERWRFSFCDSLIVAAALSAGCTIAAQRRSAGRPADRVVDGPEPVET